MTDDTHECPRGGCTRRVAAHLLMCPPDWGALPKPFRQAVWTAWQDGRGAGTPAHQAAVRAAIKAANRKQGP